MKEYLDISSLLKESAEQHIVTSPDGSWVAIKKRLHQKKKRRIAIFWISSVAAIAIVGVFIATYFSKKNNISSINTPSKQAITIPQNDTSHKMIQQQETPFFDELTSSSKYFKKEIQLLNPIIEKEIITKNIASYQNAKNPQIKTVTLIQNEKETKITKETIELEKNEENEITYQKMTDAIKEKKGISSALNEEKKSDSINTKLEKQNKPTLSSIAISNSKPRLSVKKWQKLIQLNINQLLVSDHSIINALENNFSNTTTLSPNNNIRISALPNYYEKGISMQAAFLFEKSSAKKIKIQLGASVQYLQYLLNAFNASFADVRVVNNSLSTSTTVSNNSNSTFTAIPNFITDLKKYQIKNNALQLGFVVGTIANIKKLSTKTSIVANAQIIPTVFLSQNFYWFNNNNKRFFEDKNLSSKLLVQQNLGFQIQTKIKNIDLSVGPSVQFNWNKVNKTTTGLNDLNWSSIGLQTQIKF